jgi:hypothetical protein
MPSEPNPEEIAKWHRWFAIETNNRAWALADQTSLATVEREEMLDAAHASAMHWRKVGSELNIARSEMLLALAHALAGSGTLAMFYARRCHEYALSHESPDWEIAFAHAVLAYAAFATNEMSLYERQYSFARDFGDAISDDEEREIFRRTFRKVPVPSAAASPTGGTKDLG